jgi:hypothetical protein
MDSLQTHTKLTGMWREWDRSKTAENAERFRNLLGQSCKGKWMETNHRYFFELEEDYEMFLVMLNLIV